VTAKQVEARVLPPHLFQTHKLCPKRPKRGQKKHMQEAYCIPIPPMQVPTCRAIRMLMLKPDKAAMPSRKTACILRAMPVNLPGHTRVSLSCHTGMWLQGTCTHHLLQSQDCNTRGRLGKTTKKDLAASRRSASLSNPTAHQYASPIVSILTMTAVKASKES
jgi:hypothetical protein